ncbi:MAG: ComF family protein [Patescibacteria group bacterium]
MSLKKLLLNCLFPKQCYGCGASKTWLCQKCFSQIKKYQWQAPRHLEEVDNVLIASEYNDPVLKEIIQAFKFNFNTELVIPLAALLYSRIDLATLNKNYLIVPIPLHKKRQAWRGFNQSELIADELSKLTGWIINKDLIKIKKTKEQAGLKETERLVNQLNAFIWKGANLAGQDIILLDDIITSGATISQAALVLKQAGASEIVAMAVAKG